MENPNKPETNITHISDFADMAIIRGRKVYNKVRIGPNMVHAMITHEDGSIDDLGISQNLLTNIGRDWLAAAMGAFIPAGGAGSPATAVSATSITATGTPWTASNLATPQLGLAGMRVYASVTGITTPPVYGNIVSNTTSVATIDQWWTAVDGVGTTPATANGFIIGAGGMGSARFMALTTSATAASATDTTLPTENNAFGCSRALATYAHTFGAATYTLQKAYTITGTITALHKMGLFVDNAAAGAGLLVYETVLNADATVVNGDTLTVTETVTLAG